MLDDPNIAIQGWLPPEICPDPLPMQAEAYGGLSRIASLLAQWRPEEPEWGSMQVLASRLATQVADRLKSESSAYRPAAPHAMYGDFANWPAYSVLGACPPQHDAIWNFVATLYFWPIVGQTVAGYSTPLPALTHRKRLEEWLRESPHDETAHSRARRLLHGKRNPSDICAVDSRKTARVDQPLWRALSAYAEAYLDANDTDHVDLPDFQDDGMFTGVVQTIDAAIATLQAVDGVAPQDAGAIRFSIPHSSEDDDHDPRTVLSARTFATARQFNHLPLAWNQLTPGECLTLREGIADLTALDPDHPGALGLTLTVLLGIAPVDVSRLPIHASFEAALRAMNPPPNTNRTSPIACLARAEEQLVALLAVPRPDHAYRRPPDATEQLPHSTVVVLGLPQHIADQIPLDCPSVFDAYPTIAESTRRAAASMRSATRSRLTLGRIRLSLSNQIIRSTGDEVLASLVHPTANVPTGASKYYLAVACSEIYRQHQVHAQAIVPGTYPSPPTCIKTYLNKRHVGTELIPRIESVKSAINALRARVIDQIGGRRSSDSLATSINGLTIYTVAALKFLTGHRPTDAPFSDPRDMSLRLKAAMIIDKRVPISPYRIVPMIGIARDLVANYRSSLVAVSSWFDRYDPRIAAALRSILAAEAGHPSAAQFSLLERRGDDWTLRPFAFSDLKTLWPEWVWPANAARHVGMRLLFEAGARRETTSYFYGHAEIGQTPFGPDCLISPSQYCEEIEAAVETIAVRLDLQAIEAIRLYDHGAPKALPAFGAHRKFGDASPRRTGFTPHQRQRIRSIFIAVQGDLPEDPGDRVDKLRELVSDEFDASPEIRQRALALVTRWIARHGIGDSAQRTNAKQRNLEFTPAESPIRRDDLANAELSLRLRRELLTILTTNHGKVTQLDLRAMTLLSGICYGAAITADTQSNICMASTTTLFHDGARVWIEWGRAQRPSGRWVADPLTARLILKAITTADPQQVSEREIRTRAAQMLKACPGLASVRSTERVQVLTSAAAAYIRFMLAGPLAAHATGVRPSAPISRATLLRANGARLINQPITDQWDPVYPDANPTIVRFPAHPTIDQVSARLNEALGSSTTGGASRGSRGVRIGKLLTSLEQLLAKPATSIALMVIARTIQLIQLGGTLKKELATSTIHEYTRPLFRLAASAVGQRLIDADPVEIEDQYASIVRNGSPRKSGQRLMVLREFHGLAQAQFGATDINWDEVRAAATWRPGEVRANLVYPHEVTLADYILENAKGISERERSLARVLLSTLYGSGVRDGEAYRIRSKDVICGSKVLLVRNTAHGEVKTTSSVRTVPIGILVPETASTRLADLVDEEVELGEGVNTSLFSRIGSRDTLISRRRLLGLVTSALRLASGDVTVCPHDLRHAFGTEGFKRLLSEGGLDGSALRNELTGDVLASRRHLPALSQLLGHAGCDVTMATYVHNIEFLIAEKMIDLLPGMTSAQLGNIFEMESSHVRRKFLRMGEATHASSSRPQKLLASHLAKIGGAHDIHAWRGIEYATSLPLVGIELDGGEATNWPSLSQTHRLLKAAYENRQGAGRIAAAFGLNSQHVAAIRSAYEALCAETRFALPFQDAPPTQPLGEAPIQRPLGNKLPPHLFRILNHGQIETTSATTENTAAAMQTIACFDVSQSAWICDSVANARSIALWMNEAGVSPYDVTIELPTDSMDIARKVSASFGPMSASQFNTIGRRPNRRRGYDRLRIRARPFGLHMACTSFVQATHLWLAREKAKVQLGIDPGPGQFR